VIVRVLLSPRAGLLAADVDLAIAGALAGDASHEVVSLREIGVRDLGRTLSAAEIHAVRTALLGMSPERAAVVGVPRDVIVGYVCIGHSTDTASSEPRVVAVADHANLTWRSPLWGANDERLGPRFPSMGSVYAPDVVAERLGGSDEGIDVVTGVVAGVADDSSATPFEQETASAHGYAAVSSELVSVSILAAHLGWRVAAAVMVGDLRKGTEE
jgi:purine nucleoside phosphorylase